MVAGLLGWDGTKKFPPLTLLPASFLERQVDSAGVLHFTENDQRVRWVERATPSNWPLEVSPHTQLLGFLWSFLQAKSCGFLGYVFFWDSYIGDGLESLTPNITFTWCFRILDLIPLFFLCQVRWTFSSQTRQLVSLVMFCPTHPTTKRRHLKSNLLISILMKLGTFQGFWTNKTSLSDSTDFFCVVQLADAGNRRSHQKIQEGIHPFQSSLTVCGVEKDDRSLSLAFSYGFPHQPFKRFKLCSSSVGGVESIQHAYQKKWTFEQWEKTSCLRYMGDYTEQLNHHKDPY